MGDDPEKEGGGGGVTLAQVQELITKALGGGKPKADGGGGEPSDLTAQVEAAVQKVHKGQEAAKVRAELEARVKALEEKKVPERKPVEHRRVTRRMGWVIDDE